MSAPAAPRRRIRPRSQHVVLAILALIVVTACGSALVGDGGRTNLQALTLDAVDRDGLASKLVTNGAVVPGEGGGTFMEPQALPGPDTFGDDRGVSVTEAEAPARADASLIIRTGNLELEVGDVVAALDDARAAIAAVGGYVSGSDVFDQGERTWANVTYRVPVDRFDEAMAALRLLSDKVNRESTQSMEVTAQVVDLDARITNLRASEEALVEIMDRTGRIDDVLAVQLRLEEVRGRIERLEAQRKTLADQAANSTLSVSWFTPVAAVAVAQEGWSLATEVDAALAQTVEALQRVAGFGVWVAVVGLPVVALPLLLLLAVALILRRRLRNDAGGSPTPTTTAAE